MIDHAALGQAIRDARQRAGLTQAALAAALGTRTKRIANIEGGSARLATTEIPAVADALDIDPDTLYAAAGVVPHDIAQRLAGDVAAMRTVRDALGMPT